MRLGLLADIHEHNEHLRSALERFRRGGVDQVVLLGDVFELGERIDQTVRLLREAGAVGVWGNHDGAFSEEVVDFMTGLRPRREIDGCLFTHVEPWLDTENPADLWYLEGPPDTAKKAARSFEATENRIMFTGHFHRWLIAKPGEVLPWQGDEPIRLDPDSRYLIVIGGLCDGRYAVFDTRSLELVPYDDGR